MALVRSRLTWASHVETIREEKLEEMRCRGRARIRQRVGLKKLAMLRTTDVIKLQSLTALLRSQSPYSDKDAAPIDDF